MSEEKFFKQALPKIDFFKLRASYGELGMDDTSPYLYVQSYRSTAPSYSYIIGGKGQTAYYTSNYVYKDLTWSRSRSFNVGLDLNAWGGNWASNSIGSTRLPTISSNRSAVPTHPPWEATYRHTKTPAR